MNNQQGQALIEMMVMVAVLLVVGAALLWLQRWQQIKLQIQHHAALSAFRHASTYELGSSAVHLPDYVSGLYSPLSHSTLRQQHHLLRPQLWQPLAVAHNDGLFGFTGRSRFVVQALEQPQSQKVAWGLIRPELKPDLQVQSQITIEVGAGAAHGAQQTTERLRAHHLLWRSAAQPSELAVEQLTPLLRHVDAAWPRAVPHPDWLMPWQAAVPKPYLP